MKFKKAIKLTIQIVYFQFIRSLFKLCLLILEPVDCKWNDWEEWSPGCTKFETEPPLSDCGVGHQKRTRTILNPATGGGNECDGGAEQKRKCNKKWPYPPFANRPCPGNVQKPSS